MHFPRSGSGGRTIKGFTLIELLVVIAIISILAAILFPVFAAVREKARMTACLSNEKQIGLALMQYLQDYDETYPTGFYDAGASRWGRGWAGQMYPYVKSTGVLTCPDDSFHTSSLPTVSYAMNIWFAMANTTVLGATSPNPVILAKMTSPSKTVAFFEISDNETFSGSNFTQETISGSGDGKAGGSATFDAYNQMYATGFMRNDPGPFPNVKAMVSLTGRHQNGSNFVMSDGHARFLLPTEVSAGRWNTNASGTDCGNETGNINEVGWASETGCADSTITATWNVM
jgi:prepilin-type N-terminal cleavage/methylation domain-containing protein/prepilin-type processing-associated H-X9-DG protein